MSSTSGNMGAKYFQEFGPRFLACHVPNLACHGMSISCVSMSSVSCRVIILRASVSCHVMATLFVVVPVVISMGCGSSVGGSSVEGLKLSVLTEAGVLYSINNEFNVCISGDEGDEWLLACMFSDLGHHIKVISWGTLRHSRVWLFGTPGQISLFFGDGVCNFGQNEVFYLS